MRRRTNGAGAARRAGPGRAAPAACARPGAVAGREPETDPVAEAEEYAHIYPQRAALIRRHGRVPDNASFGPPEAWLVRALVTGRTPTLLALDPPEAGTHATA